jgi:AcrR family transcriptional regulator
MAPVNARDTSRIESSIKNRDLLESRRRDVVATATRLFIQKGYSNVSVNELADAMAISVGSLYKYIRSKENILWLVMDEIYGKLELQLEAERAEAANPLEALIHSLNLYLRAVDSVRRGILLMYREYEHLPETAQDEFKDRERRVINIFAAIIKDGVRTGHFACPEPDMAALTLLMMGHTWAIKGWLLHHIEIDEYIQEQSRLALNLVGAGERAEP